MNPPFKAMAVTLLAGVIAGSMTACSKDVPTGPADRPGAGAQPAVSVQAAPPNDDFDHAVVITALPFTDTVETSEATTAHDDPLGPENCGITGHTVWYQFTPTENMEIHLNTVRSRNYEPASGVFTGTRGNLTLFRCDGVPSSLRFTALAGQTYSFEVGSSDLDPAAGTVVFTLVKSLEVGVTIDPEGSVNPSTGVATISGTVICSRSAFFELGGAVQQRKAFASQGSLFATSDCDGVTRWEGEVAAESGRFRPGRAEVSVVALFTDNFTTEERFGGPVSATVRLRPRK